MIMSLKQKKIKFKPRIKLNLNIYTSVYLVQNSENWNIVTEKRNQTFITANKVTFTSSWSKSVTVYTLRTEARLNVETKKEPFLEKANLLKPGECKICLIFFYFKTVAIAIIFKSLNRGRY